MAQTFRTLLGTDLLSDSRGYINDNFEAVRTFFAGASAPTSPVAYMLWFDTTAGYVKERNAANDAWIVIGVLGAEYRGLLPLSGGIMAGILDMGGYTAINLGLGSGTAAARQQEVDLKAPLAAPVFTGDAKVSQDPAGNDSIPRRSWTEGRYLKLAGGTMTGAIVLAADAAAALQPVSLQQLGPFVGFNTTTGHRHDGSDARTVRYVDLDVTGHPVWSRLAITDNQQLLVSRTSSIGWTTLDISGYGVPAAAHAALVKIEGTIGNSSSGNILLRKTGTTPSDPQKYESTLEGTSLCVTTLIDCIGQHFDYQMNIGVATLKLYLLGYMTTVGA